MIECNVCKQRVLSHSRILNCCLCHCSFHVRCVTLSADLLSETLQDWFCFNCLAEIFPFNYVQDDNDLMKNLRDYFGTEINFDFNPFDFGDINLYMPLTEIDPDLQFFNDMANLQNHIGNCKYYIEESFNTTFKRNLMNNFSLFHINIRSLPKHHTELSCYLENLNVNFSVIGISETWLNDSNCELYGIAGYSHIYQYRSSRIGGGVSLFLKEDWEYSLRVDLSKNNTYIECMFVEIKQTEFNSIKNIIIGIIYRPPNTDINEFNKCFSEIFSVLEQEDKVVHIMGDYNINLLNASNHVGSSEFLDLFYSNGFVPLITKPTRMQNNSKTLIDNIFCNNISEYKFTSGVLHTDISDHLPIFMISETVSCNNSSVSYQCREYNENNLLKFHNILSNFDWNLVTGNYSCQEAFSIFHKNFMLMFDKSFPVKTLKSRYLTRKKWLTSSIKNSIKIKNKLYLQFKAYPSIDNHHRYKRYRNRLNSVMRQAEKEHYQYELQKNKSNLRKFWEILKSIINNKQSKPSKQFIVKNQLTSDASCIANTFNNYFVNIGPNLSKKIPVSEIDPMQYINGLNFPDSIFIRETTESELKRIILGLKNSSAGFDEISSRLLKDSFQFYIKPLVHLVNLSLSQGVFPKELKIARVVPLYKSGDVSAISNYRPVSILSTFSKLFEKIMHSRLIEYIDSHNILNNAQFGFRKKHSTISALIVLLDRILTGFNNGDITLGVYLDFSKAFDTINHSILLSKLQKYGIRGLAFDWMKDYISKRKQYVFFDGINSDLLDISCGVPQGSILGPLLFILYINDINMVSDTLFSILYADDSNLFIQGKNISDMIEIMNSELNKISSWINANQLSLNIGKTCFMIFKTKNKKIHVTKNVNIQKHNIDRIFDIKFLGIYLDSQLTWNTHITHIKNKIAKNIGIINKTRKKLNKQSLITLYNSFIFPYIHYGIELWGTSSQYNLDTILKMQKKIARMICNASFHAHSLPLFEKLEILDVYKIYQYQVALFMFKIDYNIHPISLTSMFSKNTLHHDHETRQNTKFHLPLFRLTISQRNVKFKGVVIWNYIVDKIESNCSIYTFKKQLKKFLLCNTIPLSTYA